MEFTLKDILEILFVWLEILAFILYGLIEQPYPVEEKPTHANKGERDIPMVSMGESILMHLPKLEEK